MKFFTGAMGSPIKRVWNEDQMDWNWDFLFIFLFNFLKTFWCVLRLEREHLMGLCHFASDGASLCPDGFGAHCCFVDFPILGFPFQWVAPFCLLHPFTCSDIKLISFLFLFCCFTLLSHFSCKVESIN